MVQAVENRAEISGDLLRARPDPERPDHVLLTVRVREVTPHPSFPNLLKGIEGSTVDIVSRGPAAAAGAVRLTVKRAGPSTFVAVAGDD
jgi:hypothetical protein